MFWNNTHTFYSYLRCPTLSFNILLLRRAGRSSIKHYIAQGNMAKNCIGITGYSVHNKIWSQVQTITPTILLWNQSPSVSNSPRGWSGEQIFDCSTTFLNPLGGGQNVPVLIVWKTDSQFFLSPHHMALHACEAHSFMHVRLLSYAKPIFRKKWWFCSLLKVILKFLVSDAPICLKLILLFFSLATIWCWL